MVEESLKRKWKIALAVLALVGIGIVWWRREPEPSYQGKTVSEWFGQISITNFARMPLVCNAFRAMGTNSVPFLKRQLQLANSPFHNRVSDWANRHRFGAMLPDQVRSLVALQCLSALGPGAEGAMTELVVTAGNLKLGSSDSAVAVIGNIHARPEVGVPVLVGLFRLPENKGRTFCAISLGQFGSAAKSAVPILVLTWRKMIESDEREAIAWAIWEIDASAATKEGVEKVESNRVLFY